jgi:hypothetical protein
MTSNERYARLLRAQTSADQAVRHTENLMDLMRDETNDGHTEKTALDALHDIQAWIDEELTQEDEGE